MNKILTTLLLLFVVFTSHSAMSGEGRENTELGSALKQLARENNLIGTHFVAVVDENGVVSFDKYSQESPDFDQNSQFLIASHTKALTSTLAAILHSNKEIDLHKTVADYDKLLLIDEKLDANSITLHQLLTHTAGFTSIQHSFKTAFLGYQSQAELVDSLNFKTLVAPDNAFRYSNTGPIVAAAVIESELGERWQDLLKTRVFSPLGMTSTTSEVSDDLVPSIITAKDGSAFVGGHFKANETMHASGGIASTAADLARWLQANIKNESEVFGVQHVFETLHAKQVEQDRSYFTYHRTGYTLGWDVATYNEETLLTRFGTYAGYSVHVSFMPERKLGVVAFTNQDIAFALPHVIANYAYNTMLNKSNAQSALEQESIRFKQSVDKQLLAAPDHMQVQSADSTSEGMLGRYENNQNWPSMAITVEGDQLSVSWGVLTGLLLKKGDEYIAHFGSISRPIKIQTNEQGEAEILNGSIVYRKT